MLSIEKCYEILNENKENEKYTKEEAKELRNFLNDFAKITFEYFKNQKNEHTEFAGEESCSLFQS